MSDLPRQGNPRPYKEWRCTACDLTFATQRALSEHELEAHAGYQRGGGTDDEGRAYGETAIGGGHGAKQHGAHGEGRRGGQEPMAHEADMPPEQPRERKGQQEHSGPEITAPTASEVETPPEPSKQRKGGEQGTGSESPAA